MIHHSHIIFFSDETYIMFNKYSGGICDDEEEFNKYLLVFSKIENIEQYKKPFSYEIPYDIFQSCMYDVFGEIKTRR